MSNSLQKERGFDAAVVGILLIAAFISLYPLWFVVIASFSAPRQVNAGNVILIPREITFDGYREVFNYALYDQPQVVREVIGFGTSMDELPMMLHDFAIEMVWAPMVRLVGEALGKPVDEIEISVERLPLERTIEVPGMGTFEAGTQGAFRFEVIGKHQGHPLYALEHVTRIDDECAPAWPYPPEGRGCHQVLISGDPDLHLTVHGEDHYEPGAAGGGNASAANWVVNALPAVCAAAPGVVTAFDLPRISGAAQLVVR